MNTSLNKKDQIGDGGFFKEGPERDFGLELVANTRSDLHSQQRVTAKLKEVVINSNSIQAEHLSPDSGPRLLHSVARSDKFLFETWARLPRRWQRPPIHFAVRRQRKRVEQHERRRHRVFRQLVLKKLNEFWNQILSGRPQRRLVGIFV